MGNLNYETSVKGKFLQIQEIIPGFTVSLVLHFLLFVFAPLELYLNNIQEFWFDVFILAPPMLSLFLIILVLNTAVLIMLLICNKKLYSIAVIVQFVIFSILYIQGNLLVKYLPQLDGSTIYWGNYTKEHIKSLVLVVMVVLIVAITLKYLGIQRFLKMITRISMLFFLILLSSISVLFLTNRGYERKIQAVMTTNNQMQMSRDTNFIIYVLDSVNAYTLSEIIKESPKYESVFEDFTYYSNTMGGYPYTRNSIPLILSGKWYENEQPFQKYHASAFRDSQILKTMEDDGYQLNMYAEEIPLIDESIFRFDNIKKTSGVTSLWDFIKMEINLVCFKYMPYGLKQYFVENISNFAALQPGSESGEPWYSYGSNKYFYDKLQQTEITFTDQKSFKYIHLEGSHIPFRYDKNVEIIDGEEGTYEENIKACLTITEAFFRKLKESNVYDNSVIVLMADHGFSIDYGTGSPYGRQNPILFVKGINEEHSFIESKAPISFEDLQEAFMRLKDGKVGVEVFDWREGDRRERRYLLYQYPYDESMKEYMQTGEALDVNTMYETGREFNQ